MKLRVLAVAVAGMLFLTAAHAQTFTAKLTGFQETAAVVSAGSGRAVITIEGDRINYELTFAGLEGGNVLAAHIHVGQRNVAGGISVFFCGTPSAATPNPTHNGGVLVDPCPNSGTLTGFWTAKDVQGPKSQGVDPADPTVFARLIQAIKAGRSYANVHSTRSPAGEIRGQLVRRHDDDDDDD